MSVLTAPDLYLIKQEHECGLKTTTESKACHCYCYRSHHLRGNGKVLFHMHGNISKAGHSPTKKCKRSGVISTFQCHTKEFKSFCEKLTITFQFIFLRKLHRRLKHFHRPTTYNLQLQTLCKVCRQYGHTFVLTSRC